MHLYSMTMHTDSIYQINQRQRSQIVENSELTVAYNELESDFEVGDQCDHVTDGSSFRPFLSFLTHHGRKRRGQNIES